MPIGLKYMLLSAMGFALMALCVKLSFNAGIPVMEIVAFRAAVSLVLSWLDIKRKRLNVFGAHKRLLIARGGVGAVALMAVYYAVATLPLAEATMLQYLHPAFVAILALFFLGERVHSGTFWCVLLGFIGLLCVVQPGAAFDDSLPLFNVFIALLGAFGSAVAYVLVRKLSALEDSSVIIFYFPLIALPLSVLVAGHSFVLPGEPSTWLLLVLVGVFTQVGQIGLTKAMQTEPAARATAFSYLQVVFAIILGWMFFGELPDFLTALGALLIMLGALMNVLMKPGASKAR
jgi:drug/metabolite transporter (DMT)-like permease